MTTPFSSTRRIEELERRATAADKILASLGREPISPQRRWVYLAKTARESVYYPDGDANTYPIIFLNRESTDAEGDRAADDIELSIDPRTYGRTVNGQPLLEDEVCYAFPMPKPVTDDKCRWILEPLTKIYWGNLNEELTPGGSAEVSVYTPAGTTPDDWEDSGEDRTVYEVLLQPGDAPIAEGTKIAFVWYFDRFVMIGGPAAAAGIPFRNDSGETIPPYAVMKVVDQVDIGGTQYLTVDKPDYAFQRRYLVNTGTAVANTAIGSGNWLDESAFVLYDESEGDPNGEEWGAWPGQWSLKKQRLGFTLFKKSAAGIALGAQREIVSVFGKLYEDLEQGGEADFRVWMKYDGQHRDTQMVLTAHDWYMNRDEEIKKDTKAEVAWYSNEWRIRNAYCSEDDTDDAPSAALAFAGMDGSGFFVSVGESPAFDLNDLLLETG